VVNVQGLVRRESGDLKGKEGGAKTSLGRKEEDEERKDL
jgi:hypothetical protein